MKILIISYDLLVWDTYENYPHVLKRWRKMFWKIQTLWSFMTGVGTRFINNDIFKLKNLRVRDNMRQRIMSVS